ncbi:hypothetical protein DUNSADRAFT_101 [Dunaliella salina]|uniref:Hypoxanthine phosphoribosyltransferase n=1 Tax=Dunaliella salina TaxID=3046 RepID=A0ABQ7H8W6_DUNSA|nr:hypothetical protein DUNSADRAFT_101 [Dunaliella salina]|eukprot:KAF5843299.1 hypothetical protein DUNSADRAFT_101 [Dunaliella salina]
MLKHCCLRAHSVRPALPACYRPFPCAPPRPRGMVTLHDNHPAHPERAQQNVKAQAAQGGVDVALHEDMERVLWTEDALKSRVRELGRQLAVDYAEKQPLVLGVLTGAFTFTADLVRCMDPCPAGTQVNFVRASSYGSSTESSGQVRVSVIHSSHWLARASKTSAADLAVVPITWIS